MHWRFRCHAALRFTTNDGGPRCDRCRTGGRPQSVGGGGGKGSQLAREHRVYLDFVGVAQAPYEFEDRLTPIFAGLFENLNFLVLDPYDIALCKLKRDIDRDFQDVLFLARTVPFDLQLFEQRYREELRPYLFGDVKDADYTFDRWIEAIREDRART